MDLGRQVVRYTIKRSADDPTQFQLVLEAQNREEDEVLHSLYHGGSIIALGQTSKEHYELVLGTALPRRE